MRAAKSLSLHPETKTKEMDIQTILDNVKIERLNAMQEAMCATFARNADDVVLLSPTGTGKTLAYLIPLALSLRVGVEGVQAVVLVPSRELALQIEQVFRSMGTGFAVMSCYGGRPAMDEHRAMRSLSPAVIVGTPGRMDDHLGKRNFDPSTVRTLVIDEFDKCLEFGFHDEMAEVIGRLPSLRRRVLLSATDAEEIPSFTGLGRAVKLDFLDPAAASPRLRVFRVSSPVKDKLETLFRLLCCLGGEQTLVFCNHRESVDRVGQYLRSMKMPCETFHGGMEQDVRERALYKFRNGSCPYLILHPEEELPAYVKPEPDEFRFPSPLPAPPLPAFVTLYFGKGKKDKINKVDIVGFLSKKAGLKRDEIGRVDVKDHCAYAAVVRSKCKQTLKLVQNEKIKGIKVLIEPAK